MAKLFCKHAEGCKDTTKGTIILECRWFKNLKDSGQIVQTRTDNKKMACVQCLQEAKLQEMCGYYKDLQLFRIVIPTPSSYEELQQKIALKGPCASGIAIIERPDGTQVLPTDIIENGEVIIFREIRPHAREDFGQRCDYKNKSWETDVYQQVCDNYIE